MKPNAPAVVLFVAAAALAAGCRTGVETLPVGGTQTGIASWYGGEFHGRPTSSREIYDMNDLTAAHQTLPMGTQVAVTNLENGRSVVVRVNDRGPFAKKRIIDLSYAAAEAIGLVGPGTARVRIEVLGPSPAAPPGQGFSVQVGAFVSRSNAEALHESLFGRYAGVMILPFRTARQTYFRVRIKCGSRDEARAVALELSEAGLAPIVFEEP